MKKRLSWLALLLVFLIGGCNQNNHLEQQGYVEGEFTYISPNFTGVLLNLQAARGTFIKTGAPLVTLEQQPESFNVQQVSGQLAQAKAQKAQSEAALTLATIELQRQKYLLTKNATSKELVDTAQSTFDQNKAAVLAVEGNIIAIQASLENSRWTLGKKTIYSPVDALVFDTYYTPGELIQAGQPIVSLLMRDWIYVVFYIPETYLGKIKLGQNVLVSCDNCSEAISAQITYISVQAEYTPPVIFSQETRDKLVYRVEAYPMPKDAYKIHPGQPVTVKIDL